MTGCHFHWHVMFECHGGILGESGWLSPFWNSRVGALFSEGSHKSVFKKASSEGKSDQTQERGWAFRDAFPVLQSSPICLAKCIKVSPK